jgi:ABC-type glycerol-3-phosphate transport system substrate-binding protein
MKWPRMAISLKSGRSRCPKTSAFRLLALLTACFIGCGRRDSRTVITIWHQSRPAEYELLKEEIARFETAHPDVHVRALYKETEELRSGFQAAALAGGGPELIFGPSDVPGTFQAMGVVMDMSPWFPEKLRDLSADDGGPIEAGARTGRRPIW